MGAYAPFDPILSANTLNPRSLATNDLQGVGGGSTMPSGQTLNLLTQTGFVSYTQTFETGTVFSTSFSGSQRRYQ